MEPKSTQGELQLEIDLKFKINKLNISAYFIENAHA